MFKDTDQLTIIWMAPGYLPIMANTIVLPTHTLPPMNSLMSDNSPRDCNASSAVASASMKLSVTVELKKKRRGSLRR